MLYNKRKEMKSQYIRTLYEFDNNNLDIYENGKGQTDASKICIPSCFGRKS